MKRLFWLGVGAAAGASGTIWAERKVRAQVEAIAPEQLVRRAGQRATDVGRTVLDAINEGRTVMRAREFELRNQYQPGAAAEHRDAGPNGEVRWPLRGQNGIHTGPRIDRPAPPGSHGRPSRHR